MTKGGHTAVQIGGVLQNFLEKLYGLGVPKQGPARHFSHAFDMGCVCKVEAVLGAHSQALSIGLAQTTVGCPPPLHSPQHLTKASRQMTNLQLTRPWFEESLGRLQISQLLGSETSSPFLCIVSSLFLLSPQNLLQAIASPKQPLAGTSTVLFIF